MCGTVQGISCVHADEFIDPMFGVSDLGHYFNFPDSLLMHGYLGIKVISRLILFNQLSLAQHSRPSLRSFSDPCQACEVVFDQISFLPLFFTVRRGQEIPDSLP